MNKNIIYIDDLTEQFGRFSEIIQSLGGKRPICANSLNDEIIVKSINDGIDIAFIDYYLEGDFLGTKVAEELKKLHNKCGHKIPIYFILLTGQGSEAVAKDVIRSGLFQDYINKTDDVKFKEEIEKALLHFHKIRELIDENLKLKNDLQNKDNLLQKFDKKAKKSISADTRFESLNRNIIGISPEIQRVKYFIQKYATTDDNVMIIGETGTGKDLVAEAIHKLSIRNQKPFKPINCAAIPEELIEATLFGVIKDFPGFHNKEKELLGAFEEANGGTIFLDEIDRMSKKGQAKLLRFLEDKKIIKLGQTDKEGKVINIRIIAAIKPAAIQKIGKELLEDLYGRLQSLFPIIPPLNERKDDIPLLVDYFIDLLGYNYYLVKRGGENGKLNENQYPFNKYISEYSNRKIFTFDGEGMKLIIEYDWKRNVRELRKFIENIFSIFVDNKNWNNYVVPKDDVYTAFLFHNVSIKLSDEDNKRLDEKYSISQKVVAGARVINLNEKKYINAIETLRMLNHACQLTLDASKNKQIAYRQLEIIDGIIPEKKEKIRNDIDSGNFDNTSIVGLFCKSKKGKEGMAFEGVYGYLTQEFFDLYYSNDPNILKKIGDVNALKVKLDDTIRGQYNKLNKL